MVSRYRLSKTGTEDQVRVKRQDRSNKKKKERAIEGDTPQVFQITISHAFRTCTDGTLELSALP
jgi:hypothetical protein